MKKIKNDEIEKKISNKEIAIKIIRIKYKK
jgi:hypothetical protein